MLVKCQICAAYIFDEFTNFVRLVVNLPAVHSYFVLCILKFLFRSKDIIKYYALSTVLFLLLKIFVIFRC